MYVFVTYIPKYLKVNLFIHLDYPVFQSKKCYLTAAPIGQTRTKYKQLLTHSFYSLMYCIILFYDQFEF